MSRESYGKRMSFEIHQLQDGREIYQSRRCYNDAGLTKVVRVQIDPNAMTFAIVDAVTGAAYVTGGEGISNFECLQRAAKRNLKKLLDIKFEKEKRNVKKDGQ